MIAVRPATDADVEAMSEVLTTSITVLCLEDHKNNPDIIARWTANKSPDGVRKMLANPSANMFVALRDDRIAAIGSTLGNEIGLNYVHPAHRFVGASKALLEAMEHELHERGTTIATLTSTATAHRFYLAAGWEDAGPPEASFLTVGYPMHKAL